MTLTKRQFPQLRRFSGRRNLSMQLLLVGLVITLAFVLVAVFASTFQAWGWLQNPNESLTNPIHEPPSASQADERDHDRDPAGVVGVRAIPRAGRSHGRGDRFAQRHGILVVMVADRAGVGQQLAKTDRAIGKGRVAHPPSAVQPGHRGRRGRRGAVDRGAAEPRRHRHPRVLLRRARDPRRRRGAAGPGPTQHRDPSALRPAVHGRAAPGVRIAPRPSDRAGHQRGRDLVDRARHTRRDRHGHRPHLALQPPHEGAAATDRAHLPGVGQPVGGIDHVGVEIVPGDIGDEPGDRLGGERHGAPLGHRIPRCARPKPADHHREQDGARRSELREVGDHHRDDDAGRRSRHAASVRRGYAVGLYLMVQP